MHTEVQSQAPSSSASMFLPGSAVRLDRLDEPYHERVAHSLCNFSRPPPPKTKQPSLSKLNY